VRPDSSLRTLNFKKQKQNANNEAKKVLAPFGWSGIRPPLRELGAAQFRASYSVGGLPIRGEKWRLCERYFSRIMIIGEAGEKLRVPVQLEFGFTIACIASEIKLGV
jgi:hypothetical protein